jgi:hypothetical protein
MTMPFNTWTKSVISRHHPCLTTGAIRSAWSLAWIIHPNLLRPLSRSPGNNLTSQSKRSQETWVTSLSCLGHDSALKSPFKGHFNTRGGLRGLFLHGMMSLISRLGLDICYPWQFRPLAAYDGEGVVFEMKRLEQIRHVWLTTSHTAVRR